MPKGYWIAHVAVTDPDQYQKYVQATPEAFAKYGARFIARGGRAEEVEGPLDRGRHVVIEFPSYEAAKACFDSPEYQAARAHRLPAGTATITIVEGLA